jgi:hypothetical protein
MMVRNNKSPFTSSLLSLTVGVGEGEAEDIVFVEPIALEGVDDHGGLQRVLKISKTKINFFARGLLSGNETERLIAGKGPKDI